MKKLKPLLTILLFISLSAFKADNLPARFSSLLDRAQMTFTPPDKFTERLPVKNGQMNYEYALKYPDKNFEIRYTVRPLDSLLIHYADWQKNKKEGEARISPNKFYQGAFMATMMNISGGHLSKVNLFNKDAVKNEFNADWGATSICEVSGEFGVGYKYCMAVAIHKDDVADAYYFYLSDNKENFQNLMLPVFHTLKFK